ncbi:hypothetical protein [Kitasatospora xanthocidica]|uniref:hypothetical protein n=1 Tax=Kitasatospora xanthocidica TaxID=83382 RepID=UPI0011C3F923|nr:hypothetical protein [Kitasatospora xanthocidica]
MAVREDTARDVQHEPARQGRHGRPRPFGGLFRLPSLRFSGAAMAMSTVVGISIATTLLLNEQQGIGRRAGVARVGSTPPPTPGATEEAEAVSAQTPTDGPSSSPAANRPSTHPSTHRSVDPPVAASPPAPRATVPGAPQTGGQASAGQDAPASGTQLAGTEAGLLGATAPAGPSPSPSVSVPAPGAKQPGFGPPTPGRPAPPPALPVPDTDGAAATGDTPDTDGTDGTDDSADTDHALTGAARVSPLGRDGLRHQLTLAATEPVTAFQAEFRLVPGESAPGPGSAWTDLPGAVVTVQQERGTLVYRFTTPPGTDVRPGHYTFGVRGARPAADPSAVVRKSAPAESWSVSAFALDRPRAVAALGSFGPPPPPPSAEPYAPGAPAATPLAAPAPTPAATPTAAAR